MTVHTIDSDESTVIMGAEINGNRDSDSDGDDDDDDGDSDSMAGFSKSMSFDSMGKARGGGGGGGSTSRESIQKSEVLSTKRGRLNELSFTTIMETAKFYTSLCLGTTAFVSMFAFLFLIPFVVDPAITTILANYEPEAVTCLATEHVYAEGLRNCSWASCREGCTNAAIRCHQILVNYSRIPFREWHRRRRRRRRRRHDDDHHHLSNIPSMETETETDTVTDAKTETETDTDDVNLITWDVADTRFLVNAEGCGYPPRVNCTEFARQYGYGSLGTPFPCYYSRTYPDIVVARYSWDDNLRHLILSISVPNILFFVSVGVLIYWYCPGCGRVCNKLHVDKFPIKDDDDDLEDDVY